MHTGKIKLLFTAIILIVACSQAESQKKNSSISTIRNEKLIVKYTSINKVTGVSFVAPSRVIDSTWTINLKQVNVGWVALIPYAFSKTGAANVNYEPERQYWGESVEGVRTNINQAHQAGLKVMIKPQVWMSKSWVGDFDLATEEEWKIWETDYKKYMMHFVKLAAEENVEMICIGTEYRNAVKRRPDFWKTLIKEIRTQYKGQLTYCANWDDYEQVTFWKELDFVGMSGYFPISEAKNPTVDELQKSWKPIKDKLKKYSNKLGKPILFTEYGYRSIEQPAWRSWEKENQPVVTNHDGQAIAYEALFKTFWQENWFAGGFAWKWYPSFRRMDPTNNNDWTPQNKKAQEVMKAFYGK